MEVKRGKEHTFVDITFIMDGKVKIFMKEYLQECIKAYGEVIKGISPTPAQVDLFNVTSIDKE